MKGCEYALFNNNNNNDNNNNDNTTFLYEMKLKNYQKKYIARPASSSRHE